MEPLDYERPEQESPPSLWTPLNILMIVAIIVLALFEGWMFLRIVFDPSFT